MRVSDTKLLLATVNRNSSSNHTLWFEATFPHPPDEEPHFQAGPTPTTLISAWGHLGNFH